MEILETEGFCKMLEERKVAPPLMFKLFNSEEEPFRHTAFIMVLSVNAYKTPTIALLTAALLFHGKKKSILCVHICILVCLCVCLHFIKRENIVCFEVTQLRLQQCTSPLSYPFLSSFYALPSLLLSFAIHILPLPHFLSHFSSLPSHISVSPTPAHVIVI